MNPFDGDRLFQRVTALVDDGTYLYSVQRIVCNSSNVFNLTYVALVPGPPCAAMTIWASAVSRASRCPWRFAIIVDIVAPKRLMASRNEFLKFQGYSVNVGTTARRRWTDTPVQCAKLLPLLQFVHEFVGRFDLRTFSPIQAGSAAVVRTFCVKTPIIVAKHDIKMVGMISDIKTVGSHLTQKLWEGH